MRDRRRTAEFVADLYDGPRRFHFLRCTHTDDVLEIDVDMLLPDGRWEIVDRVSLPKSR